MGIHAIHWPCIRGLAASAGVRLRANETEISAAPWALRLGKGLYFTYLYEQAIVKQKYETYYKQPELCYEKLFRCILDKQMNSTYRARQKKVTP